jgi:hypothetical protein
MGMDETNICYIFRTRWLKYQQKARFPWLLLWQLWRILISMQFWQFVVLQMSWIMSIADFGILEDKDMFEMVKRLGNRNVAAGHVDVGAVQVKKLQALCYWVCDQ